MKNNALNAKIPETQHAVSSFITNRWSARAFSEKMIAQEELDTLFEAASWSASSMNDQPWEYLIAKKGTPAYDQMTACLMDGNKVWAEHAPIMILSLGRKTLSRNGHANRHYMHDVGAANNNLLMQAADLDIFGHMMGGFFMDKAIETFDIDTEKLDAVCFIALGYLAAPESLDEPFRSRELAERTRNDISTFTKYL